MLFTELNNFAAVKTCKQIPVTLYDSRTCLQDMRNGSKIIKINHASQFQITSQRLQLQPCILGNLMHHFELPLAVITTEHKNLVQLIQYCPRDVEFKHIHITQMDTITVTKKLRYLITSKFQVIFLLCSLKCTTKVIDTANQIGFNDKYIWIVMHMDLLYVGISLPRNLLSVVYSTYETYNFILKHKNQSEAHSHDHGTGVISKANFTSMDGSFQVLTRANHTKWLLIGESQNNKVELLPNAETAFSFFPLHHKLKKLTVVTIIESPFTFFHKGNVYDHILQTCTTGKLCWTYVNISDSKVRKPHCCLGYCIDMLAKIEEDLNVVTEVYIVEDSQYGAKDKGKWVGMVGDVYYGKADVSLAALTINAKRAEVIDFTEPYLVGGVGIAALLETKLIPFFNIEAFAPLSSQLWLTIFCITFGSSFILMLTERYGNPRKTTWSYPWVESITYLVGLTFDRFVGGVVPSNTSTKITAISISLCMLIVMSTYTAVMTANKVTHTTSLPITGFKDKKIIQPTSSFTYATIQNSAFTQMFHDSKDPNWNRMYYFMKDYNFRSTEKAFERLKAGQLNAIIHDYPVIAGHIAKEEDCKIQFAGEPIKDAGYGLAVRKGSALKAKLSELIRKYQEDGTLIALQKTWISSKCVTSKKGGNEQMNEIGINFLGGLFSLVLSCVFLSIFILFLECLVAKFLQRKYKRDITLHVI